MSFAFLPLSHGSSPRSGGHAKKYVFIYSSRNASPPARPLPILARLRVATGCGAKELIISYSFVLPLAASSCQPTPSFFMLPVWHRWLHSQRLARPQTPYLDIKFGKAQGCFSCLVSKKLSLCACGICSFIHPFLLRFSLPDQFLCFLFQQ